MAKAKTTRKTATKTTAKAKAPARKAKTTTIKRGDETPEAKASTEEQQAAAEKMFKDADEASLRGLPPDMTVEQHDALVRKAALGG